MRETILISVFFFSGLILFAQEITVTGQVTSIENDSVLTGIIVQEKGTNNGTLTDLEGIYTISVSGDSAILVFMFEGMKTQEILVGSRSLIDVQLSVHFTHISEVVITGYGQRNKESFSGSATTVGNTLIENRPVNTIDQVLQGNVPGLQLIASSGTPGSIQDISIRGLSSINASNSPLFVIDGLPVISESIERSSTGSLSPLSTIDPNDVESITVLKDASATALYGVRGANGVIIITTKKGESGAPKITFNAQYGIVDRPTPAPKMLNAAQWDELFYEGHVNAGNATDIADAKAKYDSGWDGITDTDWAELILNPNARSTQYNLNAKGGGEKSNYYASVGYFNQDGLNSGVNLERITGNVNMSTQLNDQINFQNNVSLSKVEQNGQLEGFAYYGNPDASVMFSQPTDPAYNPDGSVNTNLSGAIWNPVYFPKKDIRRIESYRARTNSQLTIALTNSIQFISNLGLDYIGTEELVYQNREYGGAATRNGNSQMQMSRNFNYVLKNQLIYTLELSPAHKTLFSAVYETQKNDYKTSGTGGYGFETDELHYPSSASTINYSSGYTEDWSLNSGLLIANYSFKNKIFFDASIRAEGSSHFASGNRWGIFYAVGGSWLISEEDFLSSVPWLNMMKLRSSYGSTGNNGTGQNQYQSFLDYTGSYLNQQTILPKLSGNQRLRWEKNNQLTIGTEMTFIDRLNFSVEYYHKNSMDLLLDVPLSRTSGFLSQRQNLGNMYNKGFEAASNIDIISNKSFLWNLGFNVTTVKNVVTKLPKDGNGNEIGVISPTYKITEGEAAYSYYMPVWAGVDSDTGKPLWYSNETMTETTSTYSEAASIIQDGSRIATLFAGLNTNLDFKGIFLTANIYYQTGNYIYDTWGGYTQSDGAFTNTNSYARQYNRWQKPGDNAPNPINVYENQNGSNSHSTRRLYDGTFLRLRNITLGYNLPENLVSSMKLSGISIYAQGYNFWTWKKDPLLEFDPEVGISGELSITPSVLKTITAGITIKL